MLGASRVLFGAGVGHKAIREIADRMRSFDSTKEGTTWTALSI
jgi:hypothetical protein